MHFEITKPIIFFDLETTGVDVARDRIVAISCIKLNPDQTTETKSSLVNPTIPIPLEASEIHGITNDMLIGKPTFGQLSKAMHEYFSGCDLGGFNNNHFDNTVLSEEFARVGILFPDANTKSVDVGIMFKKFERRTLSAAMKFYCGVDDFESIAHDATQDTLATLKVFYAMIDKYDELKGKNTEWINDFCRLKEGQVDLQGKLYRDADGFIRYNFGESKGLRVIDNKNFANWMLQRDFTLNTKLWIRRALEEEKNALNEPTLFDDLPK